MHNRPADPAKRGASSDRTVFRWSLVLGVLGVLGGLLARDPPSIAASIGIAVYGWALWRGWIRE